MDAKFCGFVLFFALIFFSCKKIAMDKLDGEWRLHKQTFSSGEEFYSETETTCGFSAPLFGIFCKWRWTFDNKGNATYTICQELTSEASCQTVVGTYELKDNNIKILFNNSFFSIWATMSGENPVLELTELKRNVFKVQALSEDSLHNEYRTTYEFRRIE